LCQNIVNVVDDIKSKRNLGVVRCGFITHPAELASIAAEFSLSPDAGKYRRVAKGEAEQVLKRILHKDMAYNSEIMSAQSAAQLSGEFLRRFDDGTASFYTNIDYSGEGRALGPSTWAGPDWKPVTEATFDAGVIAISQTEAACLWIEDED
jgi:hypothetical protein